MDESPAAEAGININGERVTEDSILVEDLPSQMKVESSYPCVYNVDLEKNKKTDLRLDAKIIYCSSSFQKRCAEFSEREKRRASLRDDIKIERSAKKLEKIWKNRGLPVEQEMLHSATSKDAFDMRVLNESLPSASGKKWGCIGFRRMRQNFGRLERIRYSMSSHTSQLGKLLDATPLPNIETSLAANGLVRGHVKSCLRKTQKMARAEHKETPASDEQKETCANKYNSCVEKFLRIWESRDAPACLDGQKTSLGSTTAKIPLDDELEEKDSYVVNNLQNVEFPPLLNLSWDSDKNWNTDLFSPGLSVPLNSPTKWNLDVNGSESAPSMAKLLSEMQHSRLKDSREVSKLCILNSHRGVFSEDMDGSECDKSSSQQTSRFPHNAVAKESLKFSSFELRNARRSLNYPKDQMGSLGYDMQTMRQLFRMKTRVSSENKRSIESRFSSCNMDSDKVLPD